MASNLEVGMKLHATYTDGEFYPAVVEAISTSAKRAKAPVKVSFVGYDESAWKALSELKSKKLPKAAGAKAKAKAKAKAVTWDYSGLSKGMRVQAEADGKYYPAEIVTVATKAKSRADAPVKVHWVGYTAASDEWVDGSRLRAKALAKKAPGGKGGPWGGGCPWQFDKTAFKTWVRAAVEVPDSSQHKELYGFLAECFLDSDSDRDGLLAASEFDFLIEKAAAIPRRFGMAPSWTESYGDAAKRQAGRKEMFKTMDTDNSGTITIDEWIAYSMKHITEKVKGMDSESLDFAHLQKGKDSSRFLSFLSAAFADKKSEEYRAFYEFLFKTFVDSDVEKKGAIPWARFDRLIVNVAKAPRKMGLVPPIKELYEDKEAKEKARKAMFDEMDKDGSGTITFDEFLKWSVAHTEAKVKEALSKQPAEAPAAAPAAAEPAAEPKARPAATSTRGSPWGGGCTWQYDKTAFTKWVKAAIRGPKSSERRELYGFLAECFLDADMDRDGLVTTEEFDFMIDKAAAIPRRFGLAPSWTESYGDEKGRKEARTAMFKSMDTDNNGTISIDEWVSYFMKHIEEKVNGMEATALDFAHLHKSDAKVFVEYCDKALADKKSEQYKSLYEFLFKTFVESDVKKTGAVAFEQFDRLIEKTAKAPRVVGLAPKTKDMYPDDKDGEQKTKARKALFDGMDKDKSGAITFDEFLKWAIDHIAGKLKEHKAKQ